METSGCHGSRNAPSIMARAACAQGGAAGGDPGGSPAWEPGRMGEVAAYRYFYDCEFIEDGRLIDLVSIGVVDERGREYYAVSTQFDESRAGAWVRKHVLDKLPSPADKVWRS